MNYKLLPLALFTFFLANAQSGLNVDNRLLFPSNAETSLNPVACNRPNIAGYQLSPGNGIAFYTENSKSAIEQNGNAIYLTSNNSSDSAIEDNLIRLLLNQGNGQLIQSHSFLTTAWNSNIRDYPTTNTLNFAISNNQIINTSSAEVLGSLTLPPQGLMVSNAQLLTNISVQLQGSLTTEEQHDVNAFNFNRSDYSAWLKGSASDFPNGVTSLAIFTGSTNFPKSQNGEIIINQGNDKKFGLRVDSEGGIVGWSNNPTGSLLLNASSIQTDGQLTVNSLIRSEGLVVSNESFKAGTIPTTIRAWFYAKNTKGNAILIEDQETNNDGNAGLYLNQNGTINSILTISSKSTSQVKLPGSLFIESTSPNGIIFNTTNNGIESSGSIRFAVNSDEFARVDISRCFLIGTEIPDESSIFTVVSTDRGARFPTMTSSQRQHIKNPKEGTEVYDTDLHKKCIYTGNGWEKIESQPIREKI